MENMEKELWIERIMEYRSSGLSALKWSEANNVSVHTLRNRICKYNKEDKIIANKANWVSVIPENKLTDKETSKSLKVTVGKAMIEVTPGFDHDTLKSLIEILSHNVK